MTPRSPEHVSRTPSPPQEALLQLPTYLTTPLEPIRAGGVPLFTGLEKRGRRREGGSQTMVHGIQRYFLANRTRDIFRTATVHVPRAGFTALSPPTDHRAQQDFMNACDEALQIEKTFAERRKYDVCSAGDSRNGQLSVVMSELDNVWNVQNFGLFSDVDIGTVVARIHVIESVSSFFAFVPVKEVLPNVPRLEMQPAQSAGLGAFDLCVGGGDCVGKVNVYRYYYDMEVLECTREEALFWMCLIIAAELETRPPLVQFYTDE